MPFVRIGLIVVCIILFCGIVSAVVPNADFTCTPIATAPLEISCTDQSTGNPTGWAWFFGDEKYDQPWVRMTKDAGWTDRMDQASVALPNGDIVVMGGHSWPQDVIVSSDNGATWHAVNSTAMAGRRAFPAVVLHDRSILVMGGDGPNTTLRSFDDGRTWKKISKNPTDGWAARHHFSALALNDGNVVIIGGQEGFPAITANDTWISFDNGETWTNITSQPRWKGRTMLSSVEMLDGTIVIIGGMSIPNGEIWSDVWQSKDKGTTWTQVKRDDRTPWGPRRYHTSVRMPDDSIILMGGSFDNTPGRRAYNEVWRSTDSGVTWHLINGTPWDDGRKQHTSVTMRDGSIILIGGMDDSGKIRKDVWKFDPKNSSLQNPTHVYTIPGTYTVTLQTYNNDGYTTIRKNITVGNVTAAYYYINIMPVPEKHVGDKFTINATTNLPVGHEVLVQVRSPCQQSHLPGEFSGASGTVKVEAGAYCPGGPCSEQVNFLIFDIDSSTFKPDVYTINDTALGIPRLGMSYFYVREGGVPVTTTTPKPSLVPYIGLGAIAVACGIVHIIRKQKQ